MSIPASWNAGAKVESLISSLADPASAAQPSSDTLGMYEIFGGKVAGFQRVQEWGRRRKAAGLKTAAQAAGEAKRAARKAALRRKEGKTIRKRPRS